MNSKKKKKKKKKYIFTYKFHNIFYYENSKIKSGQIIERFGHLNK